MMQRSKKSSKRKKRKKQILILCVFIIIGGVLGAKFIPQYKQKNLQITNNNETKEETSIDSDNKEIKENNNKQDNYVADNNKKLDNSGYLSFKDDPNADDAAIVSENTKALLKNTKQYPVRTDGKKVVYLTFDDGPSTTNTPRILDVLDRYNVKATFFIVGSILDKSEEAKNLLKEEVKRGHAIANHTYNHNYSYLYPNRVMNVENILEELEKNENAMKEVLGKDFSTRVIRLPGGYWSWEGHVPMKEAMERDGYFNVDWNALNKDAEGKTKNADELVQCAKETVEALGPNADSVVLLMHDTYGKEETVKALPRIIEYFQNKGFEFRSIK